MGYCNGEETRIKQIKDKLLKQSTTMEKQKHKTYEVFKDTSPSNKYLIINILNNTLMTHLTSFKNNLSKQRLNF